MPQRKISECIDLRINVGNYQHIGLTKYAEETIEYTTEEERIAKEDQLRDELVESLKRSMKAIPERLGKGIEEAIEVEEAIKKAIPEWLESGAVPNIANKAEKKLIQNAAEQKAEKDAATENMSEVTAQNADGSEDVPSDTADEDLFEEDEMPEPEKAEGAGEAEESEPEAEVSETADAKEEDPEPKEEKKPVAAGELDDFFEGDDEDLFGDL
jgi:hypothetical protein